MLPRRPVAPSYQFSGCDAGASAGGCLQEREPSIELKDLHIHAPPLPPDPEDDPARADKAFPDIIGANSKYGDPGLYGTESFCTLPRRRYERGGGNPRWKRGGCTDSQSPLLPDSRYNSSEDSGGSIRRYSGDVTSTNYRQRSSSSLNIPSEHYRESFTTTAAIVSGGAAVAAIGGMHRPQGLTRYPSLPSSPLEPLCGANVPLLGNHHTDYQPVYATPATPSSVVNSYDYHAAQLERFLEEYRSLQEQLSKMKETCDSLRHDATPTSRATNTRSLVEPLNVSALSTPDDNPRSILKTNKQPSSSSPLGAGPPATPSPQNPPPGAAPPPYWVPRTTLRRYSGDFYQS